ncbi:MAG: ElyC/SanA/YdcF family protein [Propionibacteriaceae bacterium]|nr:ElyC/SanA/YdcF family protein [Propionibacteriaceae bacterium]
MIDKLRKGIGWALVAGALPVLLALTHTIVASWGRVYDAAHTPSKRDVIVLGAKADRGGPSAFLAARLDVAVELFERGKAERIIVSGDGRAASNNEPRVMREYLEARGVPSEFIVEDPKGYDTYDSCLRARDTYGVQAATLVTQDFHVRRSVTICRTLGVDALGAEDTSVAKDWPGIWLKGVLREGLANVKMELDLLSRRDPVAGR